MITFILTGIYNFIHFIIGIFPAGTGFPTEVHSAMSTLGGYVGIIDVFVPLTTLLWCLTFIFGMEIALFGYKTIMWAISFIPFLRKSNSV